MRNPYTRPGGMFGRRNAGGFTRASAAAPAGPTVLLNADWSTDTILNDSDLAITNGDPVKSWAFATGGTATQALAVAAGADPQYLTWVTASGVHTAGLNAAVTLPTPVTIPADTDFDVWVWVKFAAYGVAYPLGKIDAADYVAGFSVNHYDDGIDTLDIGLAASASDYATFYGKTTYTPTSVLARIARVSGVMRAAVNGVADAAMNVTGDMTGALSFDTILGTSIFSSVLNTFSASGGYIRDARIATYPGGYTGRAAYRSAYETSLIGSALT